MPVAYDPNNPLIQQFVSALALGETGFHPSLFEGVGSTATNPIDLSSNPQNQYGFPDWTGGHFSTGISHGAGPFQFEPGTWDAVASQHGLNFNNPSDQAAGAWYVAQQADPSLYSQLQSGNYGSIQGNSALQRIWGTITGITGHPLASDLANGIGATLPGSTSLSGPSSILSGGSNTASGVTSGTPAAGAGGNQSLGFLGSLTDVEQFFVRFGLIIIGAIVVIVALWQLLSDHTSIPSPGQTAGHVKDAALAAVAA